MIRIPPGLVFVAVGGAATATHVILALLMQGFAGLAPLVANFVAYVCAVGVSYLGNAWLTFRRGPWRAEQFARFLVVSLVGLALNQAIVHLGVDLLGVPFWMALAVVVATVPVLTFGLAKAWAFRL